MADSEHRLTAEELAQVEAESRKLIKLQSQTKPAEAEADETNDG